jgi:tRNA(Leu) C34 or U34 (ribose-2'-O)-methylase TrmL
LKPPGIIMINPKYAHNVAAAIRAASCFDIESLVWTNERVDPDTMDRLPREERMKGYREVAWVHDRERKPFEYFEAGVTPVCIELLENSQALTTFIHPKNPVYVFGPEDGGVPQVIRMHCHRFVHIQARHCLNLSAAMNVVLHDRLMKMQLEGEIPITGTGDMLKENRGPMEITAVAGWDGK